jgi:hypothetical protein
MDRVLTENEWYDGPRLGVAEVRGVPHIYEAEFDHSSDDYGDTYFLSPIAPELLALVLEDWAIWLRWDAAFKQGRVGQHTHPALPADRERQDALKLLVGDRLMSDPQYRRHVRARFEYHGMDGTTVEWTDV